VADGLSTQLWRELDAVMLAHLATISLQRLVDEQRANGAAVEARTPKRALTPVPLAVSNVTRLPLRCNAPNSVFAFGRSFAA
jgi:hypothetical protein